ncbi:MAG: glucoamylase [Rhizobium sp.]|nr:glucoamylase [Rhizobium sp.]
MASRLEDYAMIGDLGSAALVGKDGSIDWLCWPRFDSDACFAALLGTPEHGSWQIAPKDKTAKVTRRYRPNTLILETRFETLTGVATLIDFMPPREGSSHLLRHLVGERGEVELHGELILRFGYGATVPWVTRIDDHTMRAVAGPDMVVLHSSAPFRGEHFRTVGDFSIKAGEKKSFGLTYSLSHMDMPEAVDVEERLVATDRYWT